MEILNQKSQKYKTFGKISNNWPNDLLRINVYKTLESSC